MYSPKIKIAAVLFGLVAVATANPVVDKRWGSSPTKTVTVTAVPTSTEPASQCNTGSLQCCNSVQPSNSESSSYLLGLLGVVLSGVAVPIGVTCSPISIIGAGSGANCDQDPVCCDNDSFNGLIAIGCTPVDLSL